MNAHLTDLALFTAAMNGIGNMKITLDLKDFEQILTPGVKAMFKENASITDVITPFGTFHINNAAVKRQPMFEEMMYYINQNMLINAIKVFRAQTGVGLKAAKDFCERLRDNENFRKEWQMGEDASALKLFDLGDRDAYNSWKGRMED